MLVLSRKAREQIQIGDEVVVTILQVKGQSVRIGIEAPKSVRVLRSELPKHETATSEAGADAADHESTTKANTRSSRATLRSGHHPGENSDSSQSAPLSSRLDARRSPRLSIPESMRSAQRMEVSVVRFDAAVRSTSLSG